MSVILRFPPINPFRFAQRDLILPDKWGYPSFGTALQLDSLKPYQVKDIYYQKMGVNDPVCIQYHRGRTGNNSNINNPSELRIFEVGTNTLLKVLGLTSSYVLPGVTDDITGEQLYTDQFLFTPSSISELNDKKHIYFELWHYYDGISFSSDTIYRGNPIDLRSKHPGTSLVEYNQTINGHDILFEQLFPRFAYRIDSLGMNYEPGGDYTVFEDQDRSVVTLDAEAFNVFKWDIGGYTGLPDYMVDIVNRSLQCCKEGYFRVDGRQYVWSDGKLDSAGGEGKHVQWRAVTLRQKNEQDGYTFSTRKIALFSIPATGYPFAIDKCWINDGFETLAIAVNNQSTKVFDNETGLDSWVGSYNTYIASRGYTGQVVDNNDNEVYFINGEKERFTLMSPVNIYPEMFQLTVFIVSTAATFKLNLGFNDNLSHTSVICYDSVSGTEEGHTNASGAFGYAITHQFPSVGSKTIRLFHRNEETSILSRRGVGNEVSITGISGKMSNRLESFELYDHGFTLFSVFNLSFLAPARDTLKSLIVNKCNIGSIAPGWASSLVNGTYKPFWKLTYIVIYNNDFNSTAVDDFIYEFVTYTPWRSGFNVLNISHNITPAPPTSSSLAARTALIAAGWNVATD